MPDTELENDISLHLRLEFSCLAVALHLISVAKDLVLA